MILGHRRVIEPDPFDVWVRFQIRLDGLELLAVDIGPERIFPPMAHEEDVIDDTLASKRVDKRDFELSQVPIVAQRLHARQSGLALAHNFCRKEIEERSIAVPLLYMVWHHLWCSISRGSKGIQHDWNSLQLLRLLDAARVPNRLLDDAAPDGVAFLW